MILIKISANQISYNRKNRPIKTRRIDHMIHDTVFLQKTLHHKTNYWPLVVKSGRKSGSHGQVSCKWFLCIILLQVVTVLICIELSETYFGWSLLFIPYPYLVLCQSFRSQKFRLNLCRYLISSVFMSIKPSWRHHRGQRQVNGNLIV